MKRPICILPGILLCVLSAGAEITFSEPIVSESGTVLFSAAHQFAGEPAYAALCAVDLPDQDSGTSVLTWYPERMELIEGGSVIQIRNRYGTAHYDMANDRLSSRRLLPFGVSAPKEGSLSALAHYTAPFAVSPDGKWQCYMERTGASSGSLVLEAAGSGKKTALAEDVPFVLGSIAVKWSPDGRVLVYENAGYLYFTDPSVAFKNVQPDERFRKIGRGSIQNVFWASAESLIYIDRELVYHISSNELYTRAIYGHFLEPGTLIGRLNVPFNAAGDTFSVNKKRSAMIITRGRSGAEYYRLPSSDGREAVLLPFSLALGYDQISFKSSVFWMGEDALIWFETGGGEDAQSLLFNVSASGPAVSAAFRRIPVEGDVRAPLASPDGSLIACTFDGRLAVYDPARSVFSAFMQGEKIVSYAWLSDTSLVAGGSETVSVWSPSNPDAKRVLLLSSAGIYGFASGSEMILVQNTSGKYLLDTLQGRWKKADFDVFAENNGYNDSYRAYLDKSVNGLFSNAIFVRSLAGTPETFPLYAETDNASGQRKRIALVFDAYDSGAGFFPVFESLSRFDIKATFFLNGEFIRRYPDKVRALYAAGHECASMFFTAADLTGAEFIVDKDFILRGLARNEDVFFACTGGELALLWHAPLYRVTDMMKTAGAAGGYRYIDKTYDSGDTVTLEMSVNGDAAYADAGTVINRIVENLSDGAVIPVSLGASNGRRDSYVYDKLDVLITAVYEAGYDIVPVTGLSAG